MKRILLSMVLAYLITNLINAQELKVADIFSDHMVLQQK